jgi:hypothetical protein
MYQNVSIDDAKLLPNILITAIDKNQYDYIPQLPDGTSIVIHDPTEVKGKSTQIVIDSLPRFKVFTIRKTVQDMLLEKFKITSTFLYHPLYEYPYIKAESNRCVSISRIDFDKHTDVILKANGLLSEEQAIDVYGSKNDLYVFHHIKNKLKLDLDKYYKGQFDKSFSTLSDILKDVKFVVDMSAIKGDGGGSQYTFLEAIHQECALILNKLWTDNVVTPYIHGVNCYIVSNETELAELIISNPDTRQIVINAKRLLDNHINSKW